MNRQTITRRGMKIMKIKITESELVKIIKRVIESDENINQTQQQETDEYRVYQKEFVNKSLKGAPAHLRQTLKKLPTFTCKNYKNEDVDCVKITDSIYTYLTGRY